MRFLIYFLGILFLFSNNVLAHGIEENEAAEKTTSWLDSDWIGPVIAVVVIVIAVWISRIIKKSK